MICIALLSLLVGLSDALVTGTRDGLRTRQTIDLGGSSPLGHPSPCLDEDFKNPVYEVVDFTYDRVTKIGDGWLDRGKGGFVLNDVANEYSIECKPDSYGVMYSEDGDDESYHNCQTTQVDGVETAIFRYQYKESTRGLSVRQEWLCPNENGSYPRFFISTAAAAFSKPLLCTSSLGLPTSEPGTGGIEDTCTPAADEHLDFPVNFLRPTQIHTWEEATATRLPKSVEIPNNETPCIGTSFTYAGWQITKFNFNEDEDSATWTLRNNGSEYVTQCSSVRQGTCECGPNSDDLPVNLQGHPQTTCNLTTSDETTKLAIEQTWTCASGEGNSPIQFTSTGTSDDVSGLTVDGAEITWDTFAIEGTLVEPITIAPLPPMAPPSIGAAGCSAKSLEPSWTISDVVIQEVQNDQPAVGGFFSPPTVEGVITFTVKNSANDFEMLCTVEWGPYWLGEPYLQQWEPCKSLDPENESDYQIVTEIKFTNETTSLALRQKWYCTDEGDINPVQFTAEDTVSLDLECGATGNTLACSKDPSLPRCALSTHLYQRQCTARDSIQLKTASKVDTVALAAGELSFPKPVGSSCTISSVLATSWELSKFYLLTDWAAAYLQQEGKFDDHPTEIGFTLENTGLGQSIRIVNRDQSLTPYVNGSDPERWYECLPSSVGAFAAALPEGMVSCSYRVDSLTGYLELSQAWHCDDKNREEPILFTATGSTYLDLNCSYDLEYEMIVCELIDPKPLRPGHVTWNTDTTKILTHS